MLLDAPAAEGQSMLLEQEYRYTYARPIRNLRHRLVSVPRDRHGAQARTGWSLTVSGAAAKRRDSIDVFGNHVIEIEAAEVRDELTFTISAVVEWNPVDRAESSYAVAPRTLGAPTMLTDSNAALRSAAAELFDSSTSESEFAERACEWTAEALVYEYGVTGVRTPAVAALEVGRGVCQDFAHVLLAICRAVKVPARYVSGHLLGEGGSHAWVEIFADHQWLAFDPTHSRRTDHRYLTVAIGREYNDVAPTSGSFSGGGPGVLASSKRLSIFAASE